MESKKCNKCKEIKKVKEFSKCRANKDGLQYVCKVCKATANKNRGKTTKDIKKQAEKFDEDFKRMDEMVSELEVSINQFINRRRRRLKIVSMVEGIVLLTNIALVIFVFLAAYKVLVVM